MLQPRRYRRQTPHGFTLVEVLLVLALMVVVAALAAPAMSGAFGRGQLRQAAQKLCTVWSQARLDAMSTGTPREFRCELGTGTFSIATGSVVADPTADPAVGSSQGVESAVFQRLVVTDQNGQTAIGEGDGDASVPLVFQPDGTSSDAEVVLAAPEGARLIVSLRGLTGSTEIRLWEEGDDRR
ncbi:hypothetical protein Pla175_33820 [Pirellulimonas nuda]|uniref:Type II secretion system protein H n=1 Tax=Pirellulimonas nuda TaxID=2528009 RepID=A0A518DEU9_9BACT|nr:prepilin-type N-terminal cleavage/methylation domain-containing protein [Pirellulimonas nuda]QDU89983.1 hypothetical protein Pla175_33820 [Pirellulimonas nuda]